MVTGKSVECGGSQGREEATGLGTVMCIERWARDRDFELAGATLAVQGFGTVGSHVATTLSRLGTSLVAPEALRERRARAAPGFEVTTHESGWAFALPGRRQRFTP